MLKNLSLWLKCFLMVLLFILVAATILTSCSLLVLWAAQTALVYATSLATKDTVFYSSLISIAFWLIVYITNDIYLQMKNSANSKEKQS